MIKVFVIVGLICVPGVECWNFHEPQQKYYIKLEKCLEAGDKLGLEMFNRMNKINVPSKIKVWCLETEQHGVYS